MKKYLSLQLLTCMLLLTACGTVPEVELESRVENSILETEIQTETQAFEIPKNPNADPNTDVDLTVLSSTMIYSQVADMMYTPEKYTDKIVKASGLFSVYHDEAQDKNYYAVLIQDATACCAQGIEFIWDGHTYPEDYPEIGTEITVTGKFSSYQEDGATYCQLLNADLQIAS